MTSVYICRNLFLEISHQCKTPVRGNDKNNGRCYTNKMLQLWGDRNLATSGVHYSLPCANACLRSEPTCAGRRASPAMTVFIATNWSSTCSRGRDNLIRQPNYIWHGNVPDILHPIPRTWAKADKKHRPFPHASGHFLSRPTSFPPLAGLRGVWAGGGPPSITPPLLQSTNQARGSDRCPHLRRGGEGRRQASLLQQPEDQVVREVGPV